MDEMKRNLKCIDEIKKSDKLLFINRNDAN